MFRRLSWSQRTVLSQAFVLLPVTALALRALGLARVQEILARLGSDTSRGGRSTTESVEKARELAGMIDVVARHGILRANCLQRSVLLWALLRGRGIDAELRIGAQQSPDRPVPLFHAWVEFGGAVLNDRADVRQRYVTFDRVISPPGMWG